VFIVGSHHSYSAITGKGVEVIITIPAGVTIHHFGFHHAGSDHGFGCFGIIGPFFLRFFACQTNWLVVEYGQDPPVGGRQLNVAAITGNCTGQIFLPLVFHGFPLAMVMSVNKSSFYYDNAGMFSFQPTRPLMPIDFLPQLKK
jgi:hypothetical protein